MSTTLARAAKDAASSCRAGDYRGVAPLLRELAAHEHASPVLAAWSSALRALVWLAFPAHAKLPRPAELRALVADGGCGEGAEGIATCCEALVTAHVLAWDLEALEAVLALHASLGEAASSRERLARGVGRAWGLLLRGHDATALTESVFAEASAEKDAPLLVHAASLRALAVACAGDVEAAVPLARRASMMGRSEGLPHEEYLAHLVLARVRRLGRQTHRALRILQALESVASPPWHAWVRWEKAFAAGDVPGASASVHAEGRPIDGALVGLGSALSAALAANRPVFDREADLLARATRGCAFAFSETRDLLRAITDDAILPAHDPLSAWARGVTPLLPACLHGFRLRTSQETGHESAAAYVVVRSNAARGAGEPCGHPRRVLSWGKELLGAGDVTALAQSRRVEGRVETLLAVLALAGEEGSVEEDCFAQTYGFDYVAERHRTVFDVLIHRARAFVEGHAMVRRERGVLRLEPLRSFVVPDPRCAERVTDRLLRILAQRGQASARAMAVELGISLRGAQEALSELSGQGACDTHREGRNITYVVEDTVFSEPTSRLHARQLEEAPAS